MSQIRRRIFTLSLLIAIFQKPLALFAVTKPKFQPKYVGQKVNFQGRVFTAVKGKVNGKIILTWDSGKVLSTPAPTKSPEVISPSPTPSVTPRIVEKIEIVIAQSNELPSNSVKKFEGINRYGYQKGYIVIRSESNLIALSDICTHQGCKVNIEKEGFHCPCHNALFDVKNGQVLRGPAAHPLESIPVREESGKIIVTD